MTPRGGGLASTEPTPHPSPSELPMPSTLPRNAHGSTSHPPQDPAATAAAPPPFAAPPLHASDLAAASAIGASADWLAAADGGDGAEGTVVLDQFVSGLLATPCIRKRLDRLYGKAPARSLSAGSRLDTLPSSQLQGGASHPASGTASGANSPGSAWYPSLAPTPHSPAAPGSGSSGGFYREV